jgi:hypothetical protein
MCKGADKDNCDWSAQHSKSVFQAAVGRLVHGVTSGWAKSSERLPDPPACAQNGGVQSTCTTETSGTGVCSALTSCICDHCACEALDCAVDPTCKAVLVCRQERLPELEVPVSPVRRSF